jgi:hypothetical protein
MIHKLYKVWMGKGDGLYGRYTCKDNVSQWLSKVDADACIAAGIGARKNGPTAPYYAILEIEAVSGDMPRPENACINGGWVWPSNGVLILSTEAAREGIVKDPSAAKVIPPVQKKVVVQETIKETGKTA